MSDKTVEPTDVDEPEADDEADSPDQAHHEVGAPDTQAEAEGEDEVEDEADPAVAELEAKVAELREENDKLARSSAFYENRRRNAERQLEELRTYGIESFARKMVGVRDSLTRAHEATSGENAELDGIREGIEMVLKQFDDALTAEGVTPVPGVGEPFDPNVHEALAQQPVDDMPPNHVAAEYQRGYRLKDRLLRPAGVIVSVEAPADES
ncbi:nucleotide exchange factor GrpE [Candidatus Poribacteria bacterium]|jgi:molecular chaperone GrpE|nr:nucleotide exchange factor GrpE [Candidatus Poribacteria bacterium]MBT5532952.1 nucleotide exchange factor GrpE [Candidatus Poribacteria bacterium]MBT5709442.1 nucleotide exchange factor GrpE [Candidatus Poribacteria bacterium]MBT7099961.1 nucleotide exchange factor GrpE [Candidatus Poribacteria bacterium]MBT7807732.1 nucleotide exchange factor GrpE [Candidatus Poribacteria bacterium]